MKMTVPMWMTQNGLTIDSMAQAVGYSTGMVANWRQHVYYPSERAEKTIRRAGQRRGWTPFPSRPE